MNLAEPSRSGGNRPNRQNGIRDYYLSRRAGENPAGGLAKK